MTDPETILLTRSDGALTITLDRPEALNAWNARLGEELLAAITEAAADDEVRAVCITGAGRAFSSGADLRDATTATLKENGRPDLGLVLRDRYNPILRAIRGLPKPVLAAVNGPAVGIGLSLALAADLIVARRSAYLLLAFVNIGLVPDGGASATVAERVGLTRAAELALLGERLGAEQAAEWGLINRAVDDERFDDEVAALLTRLANGPTLAYGAIKHQLESWRMRAFSDQLELEAELQDRMADSADFLAGVTGFLSKQAPTFEGK